MDGGGQESKQDVRNKKNQRNGRSMLVAPRDLPFIGTEFEKNYSDHFLCTMKFVRITLFLNTVLVM
jgi:hypothetical protein